MDSFRDPADAQREVLTDEQLSAEIHNRGLEVEYLRELAAALGFAESEGWTEEVFAAIESATPEQRRNAALRTVGTLPD
jgi:hypothetical protein